MALTSHFDNLAELWDATWEHLGDALKARDGALRHPMLSTLSPTGPELRTVVLRTADRAKGHFEVYTDSRTPKTNEIKHDPRVSLAAWDPDTALQFRVRGTADIRMGAEVTERWIALPPAARASYAAVAVPGGPSSGEDARQPDPDQRFFAVIGISADEIEVLHLGKDRHRRAIFRRSDDWAGEWLQP